MPPRRQTPICTACQVRQSRPSSPICQPCATAAHQRRRRQARLAAGACTSCGEPNTHAPNAPPRLCPSCRTQHAARTATLRATRTARRHCIDCTKRLPRSWQRRSCRLCLRARQLRSQTYRQQHPTPTPSPAPPA